MLSVALLIMVGILIILLLAIIALQRWEIRQVMDLNVSLAEQATSMAKHLDTLEELENHNIELIKIFAEDAEIEDCAIQSTKDRENSN